jgi:hypothetical protein
VHAGRNATSCPSPCHERAHVLVTFSISAQASQAHRPCSTSPAPCGKYSSGQGVPLLCLLTYIWLRLDTQTRHNKTVLARTYSTIHSYEIPFVASLSLRRRHALSASPGCVDSFIYWILGNVTLSRRRVHSTRTRYRSALVPMLVPVNARRRPPLPRSSEAQCACYGDAWRRGWFRRARADNGRHERKTRGARQARGVAAHVRGRAVFPARREQREGARNLNHRAQPQGATCIGAPKPRLRCVPTAQRQSFLGVLTDPESCWTSAYCVRTITSAGCTGSPSTPARGTPSRSRLNLVLSFDPLPDDRGACILSTSVQRLTNVLQDECFA